VSVYKRLGSIPRWCIGWNEQFFWFEGMKKAPGGMHFYRPNRLITRATPANEHVELEVSFTRDVHEHKSPGIDLTLSDLTWLGEVQIKL
jgi:hypothetical protein